MAQETKDPEEVCRAKVQRAAYRVTPRAFQDVSDCFLTYFLIVSWSNSFYYCLEFF